MYEEIPEESKHAFRNAERDYNLTIKLRKKWGYKRLSYDEKSKAIEDYLNFLPTNEIVLKHGITRATLSKTLKARGISTRKKHTVTKCAFCESSVKVNKERASRTKHSFCDRDCYTNWLKHGRGSSGGEYKISSWGQRVARKKVSEVFDLKPEHVVHHEDRSCLNNDPWNLRVFASQGDHVRYHRGFKVEPLWSGVHI